MNKSIPTDVESISNWFPQSEYYETHKRRIEYSFRHLPKLPADSRILSIGSWGAEAPYLFEALGARYVAAIRAPDDGVASYEEVNVRSPYSGTEHTVGMYALNIETDELPEELNNFDLVLAWELLEHLNINPAQMVWKAIQAAKIGGFVSLTTPNALWHVLTIAQLYGDNALGLKLQHHLPHATHWRLYSVAEVTDLFQNMGCRVLESTTFLDDVPFSWKSRIAHSVLQFLRRNSRNGKNTLGKHLHVLSQKEHHGASYRPNWLHPRTDGAGRLAHLQ